MADEKRIAVREIRIGTTHTISMPNYENIKVEASITFGVPIGCSDEELKVYVQDAQARLKMLLRETYVTQKRQKQHATDYTS